MNIPQSPKYFDLARKRGEHVKERSNYSAFIFLKVTYKS